MLRFWKWLEKQAESHPDAVLKPLSPPSSPVSNTAHKQPQDAPPAKLQPKAPVTQSKRPSSPAFNGVMDSKDVGEKKSGLKRRRPGHSF